MEFNRNAAEAEENILDNYITYLSRIYGVWAAENSEWLEETEETINNIVEDMEEYEIMLPSLEVT